MRSTADHSSHSLDLAETSPPAIRGRLVGFCKSCIVSWLATRSNEGACRRDWLPTHGRRRFLDRVSPFICSFLHFVGLWADMLMRRYGIKKHMDLGLSSTWRIPMVSFCRLLPAFSASQKTSERSCRTSRARDLRRKLCAVRAIDADASSARPFNSFPEAFFSLDA